MNVTQKVIIITQYLTKEPTYKEFKTDSAESLSNEYFLKMYSQHINFLNTILNLSMQLISLGDSTMKSPSILEEFNVKPRKNASRVCYCVSTNAKHPF